MNIRNVVVAIIAVLAWLSTVEAATFSVDNITNDHLLSACTVAPDDCSLRGAIINASSEAFPADDTVEFDGVVFSTPQTITLTGFPLSFFGGNGAVTVNGGGMVTVSGANLSSLFEISPGEIVTFNAVTFRDGADIGGIRNFGTLTVNDSTMTNNAADPNDGGAIYNVGGTTNINRSTISGNTAIGIGGGISNAFGTVNVNNSTISGNTAGSGGGLHNRNGQMKISNSTISGNSATLEGVDAMGGGGILNFVDSTQGGALYMSNTTVANNTASGTNLGGGIRNLTAYFSANNSIIAGNSASAAGIDFYGEFNNGEYNLIGHSTGVTVQGMPDGMIFDQDARLGPLQNNGGPTLTHALSPDSPAIDAGQTFLAFDTYGNPLVFDQRGAGFVRSAGLTTDMGSYEIEPTLSVDNTTDDDQLDDCILSVPNDCSLRGAVYNADASPSNETIVFDASVFRSVEQISLTGTELFVTNSGSLTILGNRKVIISGSFASRIFFMNGSTLNIDGVTIQDGNAGAGNNPGGGIHNSFGLLRLTNSTIYNNSSITGGGIYNGGGTSLITNSTISGNTAGIGGGGGLFNGDSGSVGVSNSTISGNTSNSVNGGGGARTISGNINFRNTIIAGNTSTVSPFFGPDFTGLFTSEGYNLIGTTNSTIITGDATGNILNQSARLAPLAFNGGGGVMTHALLTGAPAIDAGTATNSPANDQRGANRVGAVDIGAFEVNTTNFVAVLRRGFVPYQYDELLVPNYGSTIYSMTSGSLPPGLTMVTGFSFLLPTIAISGIPTAAGTYDFAITATNGPNAATTNYRIIVAAPTAATVSLSGRVLTNTGAGLKGAVVKLADSQGRSVTAVSSSFGYYRFDDLAAGQTYILSAESKRFQFAPRVVSVTDDLTDIDLVAEADSLKNSKRRPTDQK